jgi:hypothetical protein
LLVPGLVQVEAREVHELSDVERDVAARLEGVNVGIFALAPDVRLGLDSGVILGGCVVAGDDVEVHALDAEREQVLR